MNQKDRANRAYGVGTAAVLTTMLALSVAVWWFRPPLPDAKTLCPTTRAIAGHTVVIVDRTDKWDPAVGDALTQLIETAQRDTKEYEKFSIVSLDANLATQPVFSVCNPGKPTFMTDLYRGRRYTKRDFDQKFMGASEDVIAKLSQPSVAPTSPIVEYVHRWLGRDDFNVTIPDRKIILISDMRQNSPAFDIYKTRDHAALAPLVESQFGPAARGVVFDVYFVTHGHDYNVTEADVHTAWDRAFKQISATYDWRQID